MESETNNSTAIAVNLIDSTINKLERDIKSLRFARSILTGDAAVPGISLPSEGQPGVCGEKPPQPEANGTEPQPPFNRARRKRQIAERVVARDDSIRKLVSEGVFSGTEIARRLGEKPHNIYLALSKMGISLVKARNDWEASKGALPKGPGPVEGPEDPKPVTCGFTFGDTVFAKHAGPPVSYIRCTVVSLPDDDGEFTVKRDVDNINVTLNLRDKIAPFRDDSPTFALGDLEGGKGPITSGVQPKPAPSPTKAPPTVGAALITPPKNGVAPFGSSFDFKQPMATASIPVLREEAIRRQRGQGNKAVQFATSFANGHAHVASVDRMGYGTTIKDSSGHVHRVLAWKILNSEHHGPDHDGEHDLTMLRPSN